MHQAYLEQGFYIAPEPILPSALIQRASAGMDAVRAGDYDRGQPPQPSKWNPGDDPEALCKIEMPQQANGAIMDLVSHPALGQWAAAITGAQTIQVWWVQLLYKPATAPDSTAETRIGWHQDRHYWQIWEEGSQLFTAWVALSDVTEAAGPMRLVPGSHQWGLIDEGGFYSQDLEAQQQQIPLPNNATWTEVPALLPPGAASLHHCLTYHGSSANHSGAPRRSFAIHMRSENSRPVDNCRQGLTRFIDDPSICPIVYGS